MKPRVAILVLLLLAIITVAAAAILVAGAILALTGETPFLLGGAKVGLVRIEGVLYDSVAWVDQLEEYADDPSIRAVVLRIDSPGGLIGPSQEMHQAVCELREKYHKVVVASFGSVAASGGYYIGCAADQIVSAPGTLTGSIGVYMKFYQAQDLLERIGVGSETVKAGDFKDFGGFDRRLTTEEREMLRSVVEDSYDQFLEAVRKGRQGQMLRLLQSDPDTIRVAKQDDNGKIQYPFSEELVALIEEYNQAIPWAAKSVIQAPTESAREETPSAGETAAVSGATAATTAVAGSVTPGKKEDLLPGLRRVPTAIEKRLIAAVVRHLAEGKVYTGRQALDVGLVDKIGTLNDAIKQAARLAGLRGEPRVVERRPKRSFLLDLLLGEFTQTSPGKGHSPLQYRLPF